MYILRSVNTDRYYVGCTNNMERRLGEHNSGKSASTKALRPGEVAHSEYFESLLQARRREQDLKAKKSRRALTKVIKGD